MTYALYSKGFKGHADKSLETHLKYYTFLNSIINHSNYYFLLIHGYFYIKLLGTYCENIKLYN